MKRMRVKVPFSGFSESRWSAIAEIMEEQGPDLQLSSQGEERELNREELSDLLCQASDRDRFVRETCPRLVKAFGTYTSKKLGFEFDMRFVKLIKARDYCRDDRLIASVGMKSMKKLFDLSAADNHSKFKQWAKEYLPDNSLATWLKKPLLAWNEDQVEALICCWIMAEEETFEELDEALFGELDETDWYQCWENSVDWQKYERLAEKERRTKHARLFRLFLQCAD